MYNPNSMFHTFMGCVSKQSRTLYKNPRKRLLTHSLKWVFCSAIGRWPNKMKWSKEEVSKRVNMKISLLNGLITWLNVLTVYVYFQTHDEKRHISNKCHCKQWTVVEKNIRNKNIYKQIGNERKSTIRFFGC